MSETVHQFFRGRSTEAWYRLSRDEQDKILAKVKESTDQVGGKYTLMCDCAWSGEEWQFWGVAEYSSVEAIQKHTAVLMELDWHRYVEVESMLGTESTE